MGDMGFESKIQGVFYGNGEELGEIGSIELSPDSCDTFNDFDFSGTVTLSRWSTIKLKWMLFKELMRSAFKLWV